MLKVLLGILIVCGLIGLLAGGVVYFVKDPLWFANPPEPPANEALPENLRRDVTTLSLDFHPRNTLRPENLNQAAKFIRSRWEGMGLRVEEEAYKIPEIPNGEYRNLIVRLPSAAGILDNPLVIGAHYDAIETTFGADDNASGVASLLELTRLLVSKPVDISLEFVAFTNEELPSFRTSWQGAAQRAANTRAAGQKIRGMLSLEMLGYYSNEPGSQTFPLPILNLIYPDKGNFITFVSIFSQRRFVHQAKKGFREASAFPVESFIGPGSVKGLLNSDHRAYLEAGFPALMVTDTAYYRNLNYHTEKDRPETLDYTAMAQVVTGLYGMLARWQP